MKKIIYSLLIAGGLFTQATAQVRMPAPSPTQTIKQDFGVSSIELTYSRPSLKGRKMLGEVEKYGSLWRTGANAATRIRFNDPVFIAGKLIDTGNYALYTIPQKTGDWTVILNKGYRNAGTDGYKESDDVARFEAMTERGKPQTETFTIQFTNITPVSCNMQLLWEDVVVNVPIKANWIDKVGAQLKDAMNSEKPPYWEAAQYYYEYGKDLPKAFEAVNKAIEKSPNKKPFWLLHYKAKIQKDMGDKAGAKASATESLAWATDAKNAGYIAMNEKLLKEL